MDKVICAKHYEIKSSAEALLRHKKEFEKDKLDIDDLIYWIEYLCIDIIENVEEATEMGKRMEKALIRKNEQIKELRDANLHSI